MLCMKSNTKVTAIEMEEPRKSTVEKDLTVEAKNNGKYRKLFREFVEQCSAGGINKVFSSKPFLLRSIWSLLCIACYGTMIFLCYELIVEYLGKPTATFVDVTFEKDMTFPSVTVCNLNKFRQGALRKYLANLDQILMNERRQSMKSHQNGWANTNERKDFFINKIAAKSGIEHPNQIDADSVSSEEILEALILQASTQYAPKELTQSGHQFDTLVVDCQWMGVKCNKGFLRKYWRHSWNWKYGNCYTFNFGFDNNNTELAPLRTTKAGPNYGLQLDIFIEQHEYIPELSQEAGIKVVIVQNKQHPFPFHEGLSVSPGSATSIALRKEVIERVDPFGNNSCISDTSKSKSIYSTDRLLTYTVQSCLDTCLVEQQKRECNCTDAQYPVEGNACSSRNESECIANIEINYKKDRYGCINKCPQRCRTVSYRTTLSDAQTSIQRQESLRKKLNSSATFRNSVKTNDDFKRDFLRVKIYFEELNLMRIHQQFSYSISSLFADIGGQFGLWVGLSVIAFAELGDLLISFITLAFSKD